MLDEIKVFRIARKCGFWQSVDPSIYRYQEPNSHATAELEDGHVTIKAWGKISGGIKRIYMAETTSEEELEKRLIEAVDIVDRAEKGEYDDNT